MTIVVGIGKGRHPKYGCPQHFNRGACSNDLTEREDRLEERIFADLQAAVLRPEVVDFAINEFGRQLRQRLSGAASKSATMRKRQADLETELYRLTDAVAHEGRSEFLLTAILEREKELRQIKRDLFDECCDSPEEELEGMRQFVTERLGNIHQLLRANVTVAWAELAKHVTEIRMTPHKAGTQSFYVADGGWNLLGGYGGRIPEVGPDCKFGMVAGARNVPNLALVIPFSLKLLRAA